MALGSVSGGVSLLVRHARVSLEIWLGLARRGVESPSAAGARSEIWVDFREKTAWLDRQGAGWEVENRRA